MSLLEFIYVLCAHILWIYELNSHNETKCNALEIKPFCTVFVLFFALSLYKCYCCCSQMFKRFETFSSSSTSLSHYCVFYSTCSIHAVAYRTLMLPLLLPAEKKSSIINKKSRQKHLRIYTQSKWNLNIVPSMRMSGPTNIFLIRFFLCRRRCLYWNA